MMRHTCAVAGRQHIRTADESGHTGFGSLSTRAIGAAMATTGRVPDKPQLDNRIVNPYFHVG